VACPNSDPGWIHVRRKGARIKLSPSCGVTPQSSPGASAQLRLAPVVLSLSRPLRTTMESGQLSGAVRVLKINDRSSPHWGQRSMPGTPTSFRLNINSHVLMGSFRARRLMSGNPRPRGQRGMFLATTHHRSRHVCPHTVCVWVEMACICWGQRGTCPPTPILLTIGAVTWRPAASYCPRAGTHDSLPQLAALPRCARGESHLPVPIPSARPKQFVTLPEHPNTSKLRQYWSRVLVPKNAISVGRAHAFLARRARP
jgi:hypothetical protein